MRILGYMGYWGGHLNYTHEHIHIPQIIFIKPKPDFFFKKSKEHEHTAWERKPNGQLILEKIACSHDKKNEISKIDRVFSIY